MAASLSSQHGSFSELAPYSLKSSQKEEVEELSTCSVCFSEYNNDKRIAKFLPCFHTFCLECLRSLSSSTVIITCPLCRNTFTCNDGVDNLPSNMYALHLAKLQSKQQQKLLEYWCLSCESSASLSCYLNTPRHFLLTVRGSSQGEAEEVQNLMKDLPMRKSLAVQKRKQFQAHLNLLLLSLKEVEDGVRDQMIKNDLHLSKLLSVEDQVKNDFQANKGLSVGIVKESLSKLISQCEESLASVNMNIESLETQKRIRIFLSLKNSENQTIPTFPLFEEGFYSNWSSNDKIGQSSTERNLMLLSHITFNILKRWNVSLNARTSPGSSYPTPHATPTFENRIPPTLLPGGSLTSFSSNPSCSTSLTSSSVGSEVDTPPSTVLPNSHMPWGSTTTVLSYSQVLNMPKPSEPPKELSVNRGNLTNFTLRFGQKGNGKFNVSSKFLGDVLVKMTSTSNPAFSKDLIRFCRKPKELTRRIIKASPGMFITIQAENPLMLEAMPAMQELRVWESPELSKDAWDVGVNAVLDADGQVVAWKLIFLLDKFKPNNMEVSMLFGKVLDGKEILQQLASRSKQDRFNVNVTIKAA